MLLFKGKPNTRLKSYVAPVAPPINDVTMALSAPVYHCSKTKAKNPHMFAKTRSLLGVKLTNNLYALCRAVCVGVILFTDGNWLVTFE